MRSATNAHPDSATSLAKKHTRLRAREEVRRRLSSVHRSLFSKQMVTVLVHKERPSDLRLLRSRVGLEQDTSLELATQPALRGSTLLGKQMLHHLRDHASLRPGSDVSTPEMGATSLLTCEVYSHLPMSDLGTGIRAPDRTSHSRHTRWYCMC